MRVGLLWYDDDAGRGLVEKVRRAAAHYERKYGHAPNLCFVHPDTFNGNGEHPNEKVGRVEIRPSRSVLPHHFWIGVADTSGNQNR